MQIPGMLAVNTATTTALREATKQCYEGGQVVAAHLTPGFQDSFYRVDIPNFAIEKADGSLGINSAAIMYTRTDALMQFAEENPDAVIDMKGLKTFLEANSEGIETDANFCLLEKTFGYFKSDCHKELRRKFDEISPGRWIGFEKPENFEKANQLYNIPHKQHQELRLFKLRIEIPKDSIGTDPVLFVGKASGGTGLQLRMNNHAVNSIISVEEMTGPDWPYLPA